MVLAVAKPVSFNFQVISYTVLFFCPLGDFDKILKSFKVNFKSILVTDGWGIFCKIALWWMSLDLTNGSGNGLEPSGNKPLPEPMVTQITDAYMRRSASMR